MRKYYQRRLPSDPSKDYYFIHRETGDTQPLLIEYGFIDSKDDDVEQLKSNLLDYAEAVVKAVAAYTKTPYIPPIGSNYYVVQKGDSLWSIANKYKITIDELKAANKLSSNILNVNQILNIPIEITPPVPSDYEVYTVKKGDSLWSIANYFGVSVDSIVELNKLGTTLLQLNQQILIPKKSTESQNTYVVQSGDSLYLLAKKNGISVEELKKYNNLTSNILSIGQELFIPGLEQEKPSVKPEKELTYIVQKGNSLWSIAKKYGISVDKLKKYNNITNNSLSIGQKLLIPNTENYITYTVKNDDNLYKIANEYKTTINELKKINNLKNEVLSIGQILLIPA